MDASKPSLDCITCGKPYETYEKKPEECFYCSAGIDPMKL